MGWQLSSVHSCPSTPVAGHDVVGPTWGSREHAPHGHHTIYSYLDDVHGVLEYMPQSTLLVRALACSLCLRCGCLVCRHVLRLQAHKQLLLWRCCMIRATMQCGLSHDVDLTTLKKVPTRRVTVRFRANAQIRHASLLLRHMRPSELRSQPCTCDTTTCRFGPISSAAHSCHWLKVRHTVW